jgi:exodeoxyribonuclease V alpha subunit
MSATAPLLDPFDARRAAGAIGLLREFNEIGLLSPADVHVANRVARLVGEDRGPVRLAVALAARAPRLGHVFVDLATIAQTAAVESEETLELSTLPWPDTDEWVAAVTASALVALDDDDPRDDRPLRMAGSRLYLDRYWREERRVADDLLELAAGTPADSARDADAYAPDANAPRANAAPATAGALERLFTADSDDRQRLAAEVVREHCVAVIAGGPGTGKTTTVARIVALLAEDAAARGLRQPLVALAAPTGKAAARLQEAVHEEAARLAVSDETRALLLGLRGSTLHRLLGRRPDSHSRFAHDRENRLPHDVVIVDETSMVSLSLMARLVEAVRAGARLILVGDPGQLRSIEAGVVLGDIVGSAAEPSAATVHQRGPLSDGIVVLDRVHRYGIGIARLAEAIRTGDADGAIKALRQPDGEEIEWLAVDGEQADEDAELRPVKENALSAGAAVLDAARAGEVAEALGALVRFRLLCAHRRGPHGVSTWTTRIQAWLADEFPGLDLEQREYVGRPLLITENNYELGLYNGDAGVIVETAPGVPRAAFERGDSMLEFSPTRLGAVETVYAMTIHKSQGSQFDVAAVLLPPPSSRILTRELLYTAATRARGRLILVGTEETIRAAVERPVARASGLGQRLWGDSRAGGA